MFVPSALSRPWYTRSAKDYHDDGGYKWDKLPNGYVNIYLDDSVNR